MDFAGCGMGCLVEVNQTQVVYHNCMGNRLGSHTRCSDVRGWYRGILGNLNNHPMISHYEPVVQPRAGCGCVY